MEGNGRPATAVAGRVTFYGLPRADIYRGSVNQSIG